jgi:hypothetical protein
MLSAMPFDPGLIQGWFGLCSALARLGSAMAE